MTRDTWGPPEGDGWPSFCAHCGRTKHPEILHTCPVPDVAGRDVAPTLADLTDADAVVMPGGIEGNDSIWLDG